MSIFYQLNCCIILPLSWEFKNKTHPVLPRKIAICYSLGQSSNKFSAIHPSIPKAWEATRRCIEMGWRSGVHHREAGQGKQEGHFFAEGRGTSFEASRAGKERGREFELPLEAGICELHGGGDARLDKLDISGGPCITLVEED